MDGKPERGGFSLKRWSERKLAAVRAPSAPEPAPPAAKAAEGALPATAPAAAAPPARRAADAPLPPVDTLTFDADFTGFMRPGVDPSLKRAAMRKLFADPRFNVMDGLDVYIDDYAKPDPIDAETVRGLVQARYLFDPPKTRVNERGEVEEVPPEVASDVGARATGEDAPAALPEGAVSATNEPGAPVAPEPAEPKGRP